VASVSSVTQGIPVPAQSLTERDGLKLKNISENDPLLAHLGYTGGDVQDFSKKHIEDFQEMSKGPSQEVRDPPIEASLKIEGSLGSK